MAKNVIDYGFLLDNPGDVLIGNSGGPDSAILYWALVKFIQKHNLDTKVYHFTVDTTEKFFYVKHAKMVIDFVEQNLGFKVEKHNYREGVVVTSHPVTNMPVGYAEAQAELTNQMIRKYPNIKYLIGGSSNMLPYSYLKKAKKRNKKYENLEYIDKNRRPVEEDATNIKPIFERVTVPDRPPLEIYLPFVNLDKRSVKECYEYFGVTDTLFPITRSCEATPSQVRYNGDKHCGKCIFCFERETVFGRLE